MTNPACFHPFIVFLSHPMARLSSNFSTCSNTHYAAFSKKKQTETTYLLGGRGGLGGEGSPGDDVGSAAEGKHFSD